MRFFLYFNSRPRAGGDLHAFLARCALVYFNSRPRAGGDSKNVQIGLVNFMHLCCILFSQNGKRAVHFYLCLNFALKFLEKAAPVSRENM